jgi:hypothetical protein
MSVNEKITAVQIAYHEGINPKKARRRLRNAGKLNKDANGRWAWQPETHRVEVAHEIIVGA